MGGWSASHWKTATFGWLAFVVAAFAVGIAVPMQTIEQNDAAVGEAGKANRIIDAGVRPRPERPGRARGRAVEDQDGRRSRVPRHGRGRDRRTDGLRAGRRRSSRRSPPGTRARSRPTATRCMITFSPRGTYDEAVLYIDTIVAAIAERPEGAPGLLRRRGGSLDRQGARQGDQLGDREGRADRARPHARDPAARARLGCLGARAGPRRVSPPSSRRSAWSHCRARSCRWTAPSTR